jgi:hypothetical protein
MLDALNKAATDEKGGARRTNCPQTSTIRADSGQQIDTRRKSLVSRVTFAGLAFDRVERPD